MKIFSIILIFLCIQANAAYVFYRGYHFLSNAEPIEDMTRRGIRSWAAPEKDSEATVQEEVDKMKTLQRPWTSVERTQFKSTCFSPLADLVQLYTNSYKDFTKELKDRNSRTRRIFRLAGIEIDSNPFVSTSLKAEQAVRYGSGLKLFGHEDLRRYPEYDVTGVPGNASVGLLDILVIPRDCVADTGAFFVVESFARGDTKLAYHFRKNLTEEQEVIFPFFIPKKYHHHRFSLTLPPLNRAFPGLRVDHWLHQMTDPERSEDERKKSAHSFVERLSARCSANVEKQITEYLERIKKERLYTSPDFIYADRNLVPRDAVEMRRYILDKCDLLRDLPRNTDGSFDINLGDIFHDIHRDSHALAYFARQGNTLYISAIGSDFDPKYVGLRWIIPLIQEPTVEGIEWNTEEGPFLLQDMDEDERLEELEAMGPVGRQWETIPHDAFSDIGSAIRRRGTSLTLRFDNMPYGSQFSEDLTERYPNPKVSIEEDVLREEIEEEQWLIDEYYDTQGYISREPGLLMRLLPGRTGESDQIIFATDTNYGIINVPPGLQEIADRIRGQMSADVVEALQADEATLLVLPEGAVVSNIRN